MENICSREVGPIWYCRRVVSGGVAMIFAIFSLIFNGSFSALNKLPGVVDSEIDPLMFSHLFECPLAFIHFHFMILAYV